MCLDEEADIDVRAGEFSLVVGISLLSLLKMFCAAVTGDDIGLSRGNDDWGRRASGNSDPEVRSGDEAMTVLLVSRPLTESEGRFAFSSSATSLSKLKLSSSWPCF